MEKTNDYKFSLLVVPITWAVAAIVAIIIGCLGYDWMYYLIGVCTGLLNFGLMMKTNRRILRLSELYPDTASAMAKKQAWVGLGLRMLVFIGVFLAIFFKEVYNNNDNNWNIVIAFGGYATIKAVMVIVYLIFRKKVNN